MTDSSGQPTPRKPRYGFLGGSFDPPHQAHLEIARAARQAFDLDRVYGIPAVRNPLKTDQPQASFAHRAAMFAALAENEAWLRLCRIEETLGNPSYTFRTVEALREKLPGADFFWIIGGDQVGQLPRWKAIEELAHAVTFIAVKRPGHPIEPPPIPGLRLHPVEGPLLPISATDIRRRLHSGEPVTTLLTDSVVKIIKQHSLYSTDRA